MCGSLTVSALTCLVCPVLLSQRATVMCVTVSYQQTNQYGDGEGNNILHSPCADRSFFLAWSFKNRRKVNIGDID